MTGDAVHAFLRNIARTNVSVLLQNLIDVFLFFIKILDNLYISPRPQEIMAKSSIAC